MRTRIIQAYYWATPLFLGLDLLLGLNVRVAGLDGRPGARFAYYAFCFACLGLASWRPHLAGPVGAVESTVNLVLLVLSVLMPIVTLPTTFDRGGLESFPITPEYMLNFIIAGSVCVLAIRRGMWGLRRGSIV